MTIIHEFTAFHIPLRHHEAVYPGTLKRRQNLGISATEGVNGLNAYGWKGNCLRLLLFLFENTQLCGLGRPTSGRG